MTNEHQSVTTNLKAEHENLVSIICRTVNRPLLEHALRSVAAQTHRPLEMILVDAAGKGLPDYQQWCADVPVQLISTARPLSRPQAANAGLDAAQGEFILFLDDDDWISPEHISSLLSCLSDNPQAGVAYSSTQKTDSTGAPIEDFFRISYDAARLRRDNFIPIHAAMFKASLVTEGCRFDEIFEVFEDWDFWLQLSNHTNFVHVDVVSAWYRQGGDSNTASSDASVRYQPDHPVASGRAKLFNKWLPRWTGSEYNQTLQTLDQAELTEALDQKMRVLSSELSASESRLKAHRRAVKALTENLKLRDLEITSLHSDLSLLGEQNQKVHHELRQLAVRFNKAEQMLSRKTGELHEAKAHISRLEQELRALLASFSWKIMKPYRFIKRHFDKAISNPVKRRFAPVADRLTQMSKSINSDPQTIAFSLDMPNTVQNEFSEQMTIQGWCCARDGIRSIDAYIDGQLHLTFSVTANRPDIAALFPEIPDALTSGFYQELSLAPFTAGSHLLELVINSNGGESKKISQNFAVYKNTELYNAWYWRNTPEDVQLSALRSEISTSDVDTAFHLIVSSTGNADALLITLSSIHEQCYTNFSVYLVGLQSKELDDIISQSGLTAGKYRYVGTIEQALTQSKKPTVWTGFLQQGEILAPHALWEFARSVYNSSVELIYCDHDYTSSSGAHSEPCFTPEWSPEHLFSANYVGGFFLSRLIPDLSGIDFKNPAWRYAYLLAVSETATAICRIPEMLWSELESLRDVSAANAVLNAETSIVNETLLRRDKHAEISVQLPEGIRQLRWQLDGSPKVSIIIPTMGKLDLIQPCLESLINLTEYSNYEVIMLDNSRGKNPEGIKYLRSKPVTLIECNEAFNWSRLNNIGAQHAEGELLLFLNDDIEITDSNWLTELVRQAVRPETGTVGAKLLYPNGALQHSGVIMVNYGGGCIHLFHKCMPSSSLYRNLHHTTREVSANTGACLMVSRSKYDLIKGFDEELAVVGNDIDFCLRLSERGYRNLWTPLCTLIHHESISRKTTVPEADEKALWARWGEHFTAGDKYYNPHLSLDKADFSLKISSAPLSSLTVAAEPVRNASEAKLQPGVNLIGYLRAEMGLGEGARSDAKALDAAHEPFGIINFQSGNPSRMTDLSWQHKEVNEAPYDITILHINPDQVLQAIFELPSEYFDGHYTIGYWAWELPEMPDEWVKCFKHFDEIWVPSRFVQQAIAMKSPVPVVCIPHAIDVTVDTSLTRKDFDLPEDAFLFLSMFDTYSMAERKNPYGAFRAFKEAFAADDQSVRLILKINNATPKVMREIRAAIGDYSNIIPVEQVYSRREINALIANCDCYVSLHRSEGFGLGPAEAMSLGKACIVTGWSGNTDYMTSTNSIAIDAKLITLDKNYGPYKAGQIWADPDITQAAMAMQRLAADPEWAAILGNNARETMQAQFSPEYVGILMRKRLKAIRTREDATCNFELNPYSS
jgi:GT2 family glycosyltransferase/glycosyltransferase involved in cell wall biosynthesis